MDVVAVQTIVIRKEGKFAFFIIMTGGIQKQLRKDFILFFLFTILLYDAIKWGTLNISQVSTIELFNDIDNLNEFL